MTTALVLSGGGSLGAVQVGMLAALNEQGIRPDLLIGTSAGALNAAYIASHGFDAGTIADLGDIWRGLRCQQVFPFDPLRYALGLAGRRPSLCSMRSLRRIVESNLPIENLEDADLAVHVIATDALSGEEVVLSSGGGAPPTRCWRVRRSPPSSRPSSDPADVSNSDSRVSPRGTRQRGDKVQ